MAKLFRLDVNATEVAPTSEYEVKSLKKAFDLVDDLPFGVVGWEILSRQSKNAPWQTLCFATGEWATARV